MEYASAFYSNIATYIKVLFLFFLLSVVKPASRLCFQKITHLLTSRQKTGSALLAWVRSLMTIFVLFLNFILLRGCSGNTGSTEKIEMEKIKETEEATRRGYHCLLFDGFGAKHVQGEAL